MKAECGAKVVFRGILPPNTSVFNRSRHHPHIDFPLICTVFLHDEIDPGKIAETAIGVFIGLMAFKIVKIIIKGLCE